jgi:hypothetical protein
MRQGLMIVLCLIWIPAVPDCLTGQPAFTQRVADKRRLELPGKRPKLGIEYSRVAKFKLASRKTTYKLGELVSIDVAMLNTSGKPVYFRELSEHKGLKWIIHDEMGKEVKLIPYLHLDSFDTPQSFQLIKSHQMLTNWPRYLAGCDEQAFKQIADLFAEKDASTRFENNQFHDWGWGCLKIENPGTYTISAEMKNNMVVVSPKEPSIQTAIGMISSLPITISIVQ